MAKVTQKHLAIFRRAFWQATQALGGTDYEVHFFLEPVKGAFATLSSDSGSMVASATLSTEWSDRDLTEKELRKSARHEAIHLFFADMTRLTNRRWMTEDEAYRVHEAYVHRMEKLMGWRDSTGEAS